MPPEPAAPRARWAIGFDRMAVVLAAAGAVAVLGRASFQNDTWWALRVGRDLVRDHVWPWHDHFTYTVPGAHFPDHEWLSSAVLYLLDDVVGPVGPTIALVGCAAATLVVVWRRLDGDVIARLALGAVAFVVVAEVTNVRPHLISLLLTVVTVGLLRSGRAWWVPPLFLAWANLHGGVALGGAIVVAVAVAAALTDRGRLRVLLPVTAAAGLATLVNPLGFGLVTAVLELTGESGISEWKPSWQVMPAGAILAAVAVAFLVALARLRRPWRWETTVDVAAALALLGPAIRYNRTVALFVVVALPVIATALAEHRPARQRRDAPNVVNTVIASAGVALAAVLVISGWLSRDASLGWDPVSPGAVAAVRACPGNLYNTYDDGGYLIWFVPERRVFIDSRFSPFDRSFVDQHVRDEAAGTYRATFERWDIGCAFLAPSSPTAAALRRDGWVVRYADAQWLVLERPT